MYASVRAPGTCGELVQGVINNKNFLITCPIEKFSEVKVKLQPNNNKIYGPSGKDKACKAVKKVLDFFNCQFGAEITINSQLPEGKGMASSTADVAAAALATALALGEDLAVEFIAQLALEIEPSDGIFYPGIVMFDHLRGTVAEQLGQPPPMKILVIDLGGMVDTIEFNKSKDLWAKNLAKEEEITRAVELVKKGIVQNSPQLIGQAASISSLANQSILYKPGLEKLLEEVLKNGGYGINVAHSGTVIGILLDQDDDRLWEWPNLARSILGANITFFWTKLIGGGLEPIKIEGKQEVWCNL